MAPADPADGGLHAGGAAAGQGLGGTLVYLNVYGTSWRPIFLVNVPVGAALLALATIRLPPDHAKAIERLDVMGVATLTIATLLLAVPLMLGRDQGWPGWMVFSLGAVFLAIAVEGRFSTPQGAPLVVLPGFGGLGMGVGFSSLIGHLTAEVRLDMASDLSGVVSTNSELASALGVAGFGTLYLALAHGRDATIAVAAFALLAASLGGAALPAAAAAFRSVRLGRMLAEAAVDGIAATSVEAALAPNPRARHRPGMRNRLYTRLLTALPTRSSDRIQARTASPADVMNQPSLVLIVCLASCQCPGRTGTLNEEDRRRAACARRRGGGVAGGVALPTAAGWTCDA